MVSYILCPADQSRFSEKVRVILLTPYEASMCMFVSSRSYFNFKSTDQIYYAVELIWRPGRGCLSGGPHFNPYGKIRGTLGIP